MLVCGTQGDVEHSETSSLIIAEELQNASNAQRILTKYPYKVSLQSIFLMFRYCHFKSFASKRTLLKKVERLRSQCMYL
jgi:GTPase SAR1 family protein